MDRRRVKGEEGFTLIEVLVALVAGGLLLAVLGQLTGMFGRELAQVDANDDAVRQIARATPVLDHLLATAMPAPGSTDAIESDDRHLTAQVDPPLSWRGIGPLRMDANVVRAPDGVALDLTLARGDGAALPGMGTPKRLVHGMRAIHITTNDADAEGSSRLVTIAFTTKRGETWPVAFEPRLSAAGGCRFDPISMTCRS